MSSIAPFFTHQPAPVSNVGKIIQSWVSTLDDAAVMAWADSMDWSEPVLSVRRFGSQQGSGWPLAGLTSRSLAEVLVAAGDERLVGLLLSPFRFPERMQWSGDTLKSAEYRDVDIRMALANAAIESGKLAILDAVLAVVLDNQTNATQWTAGDRRSPAVCLASQHALPAPTAMKMWLAIERCILSQVKNQWGPPAAKSFGASMREQMLSHACRLGNAPLAEALMSEFKMGCTQSHWRDLLHEGNIRWCADHAAAHQAWASDANENRQHGQRHDHPALELLRVAIEQVSSLSKTFSGAPLRAHQKTARGNLSHALARLSSSLGTRALAGVDRANASELLGPTLVEHSPTLAREWLDKNTIPMAAEEVLAWFKSGAGLDALQGRAEQGIVACAPDKVSRMFERFVSSDEGRNVAPVMLAWAVGQWKMEDELDQWTLPSDRKADIRACLLESHAPQARNPSSTRRM